jgi:hypothetical protein
MLLSPRGARKLAAPPPEPVEAEPEGDPGRGVVGGVVVLVGVVVAVVVGVVAVGVVAAGTLVVAGFDATLGVAVEEVEPAPSPHAERPAADRTAASRRRACLDDGAATRLIDWGASLTSRRDPICFSSLPLVSNAR